MSWFGEHLTSITGKISDFTKEVLNDATERVSSEGSFGSSASKVLFGSDSNLKSRLAEEDFIENASCDNPFATNSNNYPNNCDEILTSLENSDLISNLNIIVMLNCIKIFHEDDFNLNDILKQLIDLKHSIESKNSPSDLDYTKSLSKLNSYIDYFKVICDHREATLPFMQETVLTFEKLSSNSFHQNGPCGDSNAVFEANQMHSFKNTKKLAIAGIQTDAAADQCSCSLHPSPERTSMHVQTDTGLEVTSSDQQLLDNYELEISKLKKQIKFFKEDALSQLSKHNFSQQTDSFLLNTSSSQTDDDEIPCQRCDSSFEASESLQQENENLVEKICSLRNEIKKLKFDHHEQQKSHNSIALQTSDLCKCADNEIIITQQNKAIEMLQEQLFVQQKLESSLENKLLIISKLENDLNNEKKIVDEKAELINSQKDEIMKLKLKVSLLQKAMQSLTERNAKQSENNAAHLPSIDNGSLEKAELSSRGDEQQAFIKNIQEQVAVLQQQLKSLNLEKNQLLCMLNEKSQESSSLKTEVHRLTSIVSSEKQALFKLQQDNKDLRLEQESKLESDLAKEAMQNLSRLVRDKDIEIEALKQKNESLSSVLQNSTPSPDHVQTLMEEHEILAKEIDKFKADREKIMKSYNAKDQKCRAQHTENTKLSSEISAITEKFDALEQQHRAISLQYEEKQKTLMNTQNEMVILKQKVFELEQQQACITEEYNKLLETIQSDSTITVSREEFTKTINELERFKLALKENHDLIKEKDRLIHELSNDVKSLKLKLEQTHREMLDLKKTNNNVIEKLAVKDSDLVKSSEETNAAKQRLKDKVSECGLLGDMNNKLNMSLKEHEFTIKALEERIASLTLALQEKTESVSAIDVDQILAESKEMYNKAQRFYRERDEALLSLNQTKQENQDLKNENQKLKVNGDRLKNELDRLRKHLLQIEENYTNEALIAEDREKELRSQLTELEASTKLSSSAILDASHHANIQVASLQEQVSMIAQQRDQALSQLSDLEDKVQLYSTSSNNLQLVLEKRQKEHDQRQRDTENKWITEINKVKQQATELQHFLDVKQKQLEESSQALEAASRLSEILDSKEEVINNLKANLSKTQNSLRATIQELDSVRNNPDGKVDRVVMKSLVLGYFSTPPTQKSEVIRLLARVLDFNQEEMQKAGIVVSRNTGSTEHRGILSSLFGRLPSLSIHHTPTQNSNPSEQSFTTLFVKFLENESQPIIRMPLPAEEMAQEQTSKAHFKKGSSQSKAIAGSPSKSPLLLNIDSAFPTFAALPAVDYNSPTILKEVLK